ncbi:MAG: phospholipid phosphatase [Candidatus Eremiobacteraeota bacterium]|nr:phospholipid phosphatase [Candidatus Eremiobacteraeota bacterium]
MIRYLAAALVCAIAYAALGIAVSHAPPSGIDLAGRALLGGSPYWALLFTESCNWYVLLALGIAGIIVAMCLPAWRERIITWLLTMVAFWQVSDAFKILFHRPRPDYWRIIHEPTFAYSSGHAMFATIVYGLWAWYVWHSDLPRPVRLVVAPLLLLWAGGVLWSRLALGAHYVTDLIGGVLLGCTALALGAAVREALRSRRRSSRSRAGR